MIILIFFKVFTINFTKNYPIPFYPVGWGRTGKMQAFLFFNIKNTKYVVLSNVHVKYCRLYNKLMFYTFMKYFLVFPNLTIIAKQ